MATTASFLRKSSYVILACTLQVIVSGSVYAERNITKNINGASCDKVNRSTCALGYFCGSAGNVLGGDTACIDFKGSGAKITCNCKS